MNPNTPRLVKELSSITYRQHRITEQVWSINQRERNLFVIDGSNAMDGYFHTVEDAQRFLRRRS